MSVVIFDVGGVLRPKEDRFTKFLVEVNPLGLQVEEDALSKAYWAHRDDYDLGLSDMQYWSTVLEEVGAEGIANWSNEQRDDAVSRLAQADGQRNADIGKQELELLNSCIEMTAQRQGLTGLLSNAPHSMADAIRHSDWSDGLKVLAFSCEVGIAKPDARSYTNAARMSAQVLGRDVEPSDICFFDDRTPNVQAALELGWNAHLWEGPAAAEAIIRRHLAADSL